MQIKKGLKNVYYIYIIYNIVYKGKNCGFWGIFWQKRGLTEA